MVLALVGDSTMTNFCPDELMAPYIYCLGARVKRMNSGHLDVALYIAVRMLSYPYDMIEDFCPPLRAKK
jgi:hypothetical protein